MHQKKAVELSETRDHLALFFEMGTGKTPTAITILRLWFLQWNKIENSIIFCPPIVVQQWAEEFDSWSKLGRYVVPLVGPGTKRAKIVKERIESGLPTIFVTNYETLLMKDVFALLMEANIKVGVFDESQKVKNHKAKKFKFAMQLADLMDRKLILTGTPILNTPMDIWSQYRVLDGGATFGKNFYVFQAKYFHDVNLKLRGTQKYFPKWVPRPGLIEEFNKILSTTSLRAKKDECLDLPPLIRKKVYVEMTPKQKRVYKELSEDFVSYVDNGVVDADLALVKILRLQQIVSGFVRIEKVEEDLSQVFKSKYEDLIFDDVPRLKALEELILETTPENKVIVWACFKENYRAIREVCEKHGIKYVEIHGEQTAKKRDQAVRDFREDPDTRLVIANQRAGGVGLNLIEAKYAFYYSRDYSLESDLQSEARNYRGGSDIHSQVVRVDLVTPNSVDQTILQALEKKQNLAEKILDIRDQIRDS